MKRWEGSVRQSVSEMKQSQGISGPESTKGCFSRTPETGNICCLPATVFHGRVGSEQLTLALLNINNADTITSGRKESLSGVEGKPEDRQAWTLCVRISLHSGDS